MRVDKVTSHQSPVTSQRIKIVFCFVFLLLLDGCVKTEIKNLGSAGKNIICFGDSITYGYGVNPGEDYPTALGRLVAMPVINAGVDSNTASEGLLRIKQDVLEKEPYLVIIEFCGNDFIKKIPLETTVANIREMVRASQARGAIVAIVDISAGMFFAEYRKLFSRLAQEEGAIFIPLVLDKIITNPAMKSDFLHPNAAGYKLSAERIYKKILPYLK